MGITIDQDLSFKSHIANVKSKLSSSLYIFSKIRHKFPLSIGKTFYNSLFKTHLTYCISLWGNSCNSYLQPLKTLQNRFIKNLLLLPLKTSTTLIYSSASLRNLTNLYKYQTLLITFKLISLNSNRPPALDNFFKTTNQVHAHTTRASQANKLFILPNNSTSRSNSLAIHGVSSTVELLE